MAQFLAYTIKTTQVVEADDPNEIRDIMDKLRECGSVDDYDVSVVEAESIGAALDKLQGKENT